MNEPTQHFALTSVDSEAPLPTLRDVSVTGRLDGLLFDWTLRQTYQNTGDQPLELIYTFPLPDQAVLLGFASELNGGRMVGTVVPKQAAEWRYEEALAEGDAPVMLERAGAGLFTANIGNLNPGDELVVEVRLGQLLSYQGSRLRLAIPTTIAPRFGSPAEAGLQAQQAPVISSLAEYPLALAVTVGGSLAGAAVECPTHRVHQREVNGDRVLALAPGAWLDRDVVILVTAPEACPSRALLVRDTVSQDAPVLVMAALQPPRRSARRHVMIKALIDCSGSMAGDSIASARRALQGTLAGLGEQDGFSLSRFGTHVDHLAPPTACSPRLVRTLSERVAQIEADLGGTEMERALRSVLSIHRPPGFDGADVLLITDGEIWRTQGVIDAARQSGHRVFAIGVGSSPAESLLRSLAESTGGACEFVTPGEALEAAAARMLDRMRQVPQAAVRIDWGAEPVWQTQLPMGVFDGDTVLAFAGLPAHAKPPCVKLLVTGSEPAEVASAPVQALDEATPLPRMAAARRMAEAAGSSHPGEHLLLTQRLAVDYQLITQQTNCILVHERAEADKLDQAAQLQQISSMLAAGWGATSSVTSVDRLCCHDSGGMVLRNASVWRSVARPVMPSVDLSVADAGDDFIALVAPLQAIEEPPATLEEIARTVAGYLSAQAQLGGLAAHCSQHKHHENLLQALAQLPSQTVSPDMRWVILAHWVSGRAQAEGHTNIPSTVSDALAPYLAHIDAAVLSQCMAHFDQSLGAYGLTGWVDARAQRLAKAMVPGAQS